jgi:hypothetical protein
MIVGEREGMRERGWVEMNKDITAVLQVIL